MQFVVFYSIIPLANGTKIYQYMAMEWKTLDTRTPFHLEYLQYICPFIVHMNQM